MLLMSNKEPLQSVLTRGTKLKNMPEKNNPNDACSLVEQSEDVCEPHGEAVVGEGAEPAARARPVLQTSFFKGMTVAFSDSHPILK